MRTCDMQFVNNSSTFSYQMNNLGSEGMPTFVIVGFQSNRSNSQTANSAIFDNWNVLSAYASLNSINYPATHIRVKVFNE